MRPGSARHIELRPAGPRSMPLWQQEELRAGEECGESHAVLSRLLTPSTAVFVVLIAVSALAGVNTVLTFVWPQFVSPLIVVGVLGLAIRLANARRVWRVVETFRFIGPLIAAAALRMACDTRSFRHHARRNV